MVLYILHHTCPNETSGFDEALHSRHEFCHPRESGDPSIGLVWIPASAGMTEGLIWTAMSFYLCHCEDERSSDEAIPTTDCFAPPPWRGARNDKKKYI